MLLIDPDSLAFDSPVNRRHNILYSSHRTYRERYAGGLEIRFLHSHRLIHVVMGIMGFQLSVQDVRKYGQRQ